MKMKKYIYIGVISLLLGFATYLFLIFQNGKKLDGEYYVISDNKMELAFTINNYKGDFEKSDYNFSIDTKLKKISIYTDVDFEIPTPSSDENAIDYQFENDVFTINYPKGSVKYFKKDSKEYNKQLQKSNKSKSGVEYFEDNGTSEYRTRKLAYEFSNNKVTKITTREIMDYSYLDYQDEEDARNDKRNYIRKQKEDGVLTRGVSIDIEYKEDVMIVTWIQDMAKVDSSEFFESPAWDHKSKYLKFDKIKEELLKNNYSQISIEEFNSDSL